MNITLVNKESDICDDFENIEGLVCLSSADIFINDSGFGSYHAAWRVDSPEHVEVVVKVFTATEQIELSVVRAYQLLNGQFVATDACSLYADPEWRDQNNVVPEDEIQNYTKAQDAINLADFIILTDEHIINLSSSVD